MTHPDTLRRAAFEASARFRMGLHPSGFQDIEAAFIAGWQAALHAQPTPSVGQAAAEPPNSAYSHCACGDSRREGFHSVSACCSAGGLKAQPAAPDTQAGREDCVEALRAMEGRKDTAYLERNQVVSALAKCFPSGVARTAIEGWSEDWHGCVYIDLPTGQVSWHFHDSHAYLFEGLPPYIGTWDGHNTDEKYRRVAAMQSPPAYEAALLAAREALEQFKSAGYGNSTDYLRQHEAFNLAADALAQIDRVLGRAG